MAAQSARHVNHNTECETSRQVTIAQAAALFMIALLDLTAAFD